MRTDSKLFLTKVYNMQVIFTEDIQGTALKGDIKNVKPGFFRNYLQPRKKALLATDSLLKLWEEKRKNILIQKEQLVAKLEEIKRRLAEAKLKIEKKVTKKGTLYGGVKAVDIVNALKEQFEMEVPSEALVLASAIKTVGIHNVVLKFGEGVETAIQVEVVEKK